MYARSMNTFWQAALVLIGVAVVNAVAAAADNPENFQVVDGVAVYLGVMPAQIVQGHPGTHPEAGMHGGVPARGHRDHVVVALFDDATGERIENAQVSGSVMELGLGGERKNLEPMRIADTLSYGNYFHMPDSGIYHIRVRIRRPGAADVEAKFTHRHSGMSNSPGN